jgi:hypothetical protein
MRFYLDRGDEVLGISFEFPFAFIQLVGAGSNNTSGSNGSLQNISVSFKLVYTRDFESNSGFLTH